MILAAVAFAIAASQASTPMSAYVACLERAAPMLDDHASDAATIAIAADAACADEKDQVIRPSIPSNVSAVGALALRDRLLADHTTALRVVLMQRTNKR